MAVTGGGKCVFSDSVYFAAPRHSTARGGNAGAAAAAALRTHYKTACGAAQKAGRFGRPLWARRGAASPALSWVGFHVRVHVYGSSLCLRSLEPRRRVRGKGTSVAAGGMSSHGARGDSEATSMAPRQEVPPTPCFASGEWCAQGDGDYPGGSDRKRAGGTCRFAGSFGQTELSCGLRELWMVLSDDSI